MNNIALKVILAYTFIIYIIFSGYIISNGYHGYKSKYCEPIEDIRKYEGVTNAEIFKYEVVKPIERWTFSPAIKLSCWLAEESK